MSSQGASLSIRTVAIIGAGAAGREFAVRAAAAGFDVILEDVMPSNLRRAEQEYASVAEDGAAGTLGLALTVEEAVRRADLAMDFVPDELESKLEIFCMIDRMAPPRTVMLTPSEALSITDLASCTYRGDRCFAVRGPLIAGGTARLIAPRTADTGLVGATRGFLEALGLAVLPEEDADAPMLVKNYR